MPNLIRYNPVIYGINRASLSTPFSGWTAQNAEIAREKIFCQPN